MQNTIVIVTLTLITGLAVGYYLRARKSADELKERPSERERDKGETKKQEAKAAAL
jgi:uncharacterized protein YneF (UPF0154 family)